MQFMVTDGGAHPPDKWAEITTNEILALIQIEGDSPEAIEARLAVADLRPKLVRFFTEHHDGVQKHERKKARSLADGLDPSSHVDRCSWYDDVFSTSPFAAHFAKNEVQEVVNRIIGQHTADVMHIERRYHADKKEG